MVINIKSATETQYSLRSPGTCGTGGLIMRNFKAGTEASP